MSTQDQDKTAAAAKPAAAEKPADTVIQTAQPGMSAEAVQKLVAESVAQALEAQSAKLKELTEAAEAAKKGVSVAAALKVESAPDERKPVLKKGDVVRAVYGDLRDVHTLEVYHHGADTLVKLPSTWLDGQLRAGKLEKVED